MEVKKDHWPLLGILITFAAFLALLFILFQD